MLTNGTPNAQVSLPKQYVRMRILNAETERGYDLGFSDNRTFYIIGNDGGLLSAPVAVTRVKLMVGERVEIMVNLGNDAVGSSLDLKAYNSGQAFGFPGGEPNSTGQFGSLLNNVDFSVLHINVASPTANPIIALPSSLVFNVYWSASDATVTRNIAITNGNPGPASVPFNFDNTSFAMNTINKTVQLNTIEKWTVTNNQVFGHTFHIHDVQFKIVARNGSAAAVGSHESGWKDVMYVPKGENVSFVAKFEDYADAIHPFMYHCHFANHEDGGMMGQFVVKDSSSANGIEPMNTEVDFMLYPNPAQSKLFVKFSDENASAYYIKVVDLAGRTLLMLPRPQLQEGIDISGLTPGIYTIQLTDEKTKSVTVRKFVKQ
jgi:bilirubin oxidase